MLPFGKSHETDADKIGLILMTIAGYDSLVRVRLWKGMEAAYDSKAPENFLSTHPSKDTRIENIKKWAPDAMAEVKKFGVTTFKSK